MGVRESKVERYLDKQVKLLGGDTRKWVSPGRDGVPDRIVILAGRIMFVEVKTNGGVCSTAQHREHDKLNALGAQVTTVFGDAGVDAFIIDIKTDLETNIRKTLRKSYV